MLSYPTVRRPAGHGHAALTEVAFDAVAIRDRRREAIRRIIQGSYLCSSAGFCVICGRKSAIISFPPSPSTRRTNVPPK
jgi:hypothetical protein